MPLRLLSIETGETLVELEQPIVPGKKMEFVEQFNEKLLLKQEDSPLKIIDLLTRSVVTVKNQHFRTPSAFIFLYENQTFLAFRGHEVTVWNFRGEQARRLGPGPPLLSRVCGATAHRRVGQPVRGPHPLVPSAGAGPHLGHLHHTEPGRHPLAVRGK